MSANVNITNGLFCSVSWITNKGEQRKVNGRTGVIKYLKGTEKKINGYKYILIFTRSASGKFDSVKSIKRDSIIDIKAQGQELKQNKASAYSKLIRA